MGRAPRLLALVAVGAALAASPPGMPPGCRLDDASTSQLRVYECQEKLRIAAEAATRISALQRSGRLVGLRIEGGAVLVERAGGQPPFQIVTAEAVTEAREGRVAVEAGAAGTAVFVRAGDATVSRDDGSVALRSGEGIDIAAPSRSLQRRRASTPVPTSAPAPAPPPVAAAPKLEVKIWGSERADRLMTRLGQR